jgi:hypothetical protein
MEMNRMKRLAALVLLLAAAVLAIPAVPASAFDFVVGPVRVCRYVERVGIGPTLDDAYQNALDWLRTYYRVVDYKRLEGFCPSEEDQDIPGPVEGLQDCTGKIRACVLPL